jgi:transcriptional regulator with XRE-family HTH domain
MEKEMGDRVRQLRENSGASQAQLGEALGLDQTAVSKIEAGKRGLTARELMLAAQFFGVTTSAIIEPEPAVVALRAGDADREDVVEAVKEFQHLIEVYFGLEAMVRR